MLITGSCCCPVKIDLMLVGNQEGSCTRVMVNLIVPEIAKRYRYNVHKEYNVFTLLL